MFAKQFSEAGVSGTTSGKKGGRGRGGGSGLTSKNRRGGRSVPEDAGDASGILAMDNNSAYRTHMLFPGRKDEDGSGEPRRSSGSPSFMKAMMSWGKRPSDPKSAQNSQELTRYRATPTRGSESEFECMSASDPYMRKTVSFHNFNHGSSPCAPLPPAPGPAGFYSTSPTNTPSTNNQNGYFCSYNEPFRENDYASFVGGNAFTLTLIFYISTIYNPIISLNWISTELFQISIT